MVIIIKYRLKTKLSLSYLILALLLVTLISTLSNIMLQKQFRQYVIQKQEEKNLSVAQLLEERYVNWGQKWDLSGIENLGVSLLEEGLILKVQDAAGNSIWDATVHNNGMCSAMLMHMAENMKQYNQSFSGGYEEKDYPLTQNGRTIGTARIGYYGPYFYSDGDLDFIRTLNRLLWAAAAVAMLAALAFGTLMSRQLTYPISRVINTARQIAKGNFSTRVVVKSNTREIGELTSTINTLAESLGNQEKLRKRLTADVAHELRTPVATLQSHLEAMIDGIWQADTERLKSCHEEVLRIGALVGDLGKLAHYESENLVLNKSKFDFRELIQHLLTNFEYEFKIKGISIWLADPTSPLVPQYVYADKDKISQVVVNLLSNALKYTEAGGRVTLEIDSAPGWTTLKCKDTGIGIKEEDLPHIFERFYRADQSRTRATGGAGIGLAIARSIIEAHNGTISAESIPGKGTSFTMRLPNSI